MADEIKLSLEDETAIAEWGADYQRLLTERLVTPAELRLRHREGRELGHNAGRREVATSARSVRPPTTKPFHFLIAAGPSSSATVIHANPRERPVTGSIAKST